MRYVSLSIFLAPKLTLDSDRFRHHEECRPRLHHGRAAAECDDKVGSTLNTFLHSY